MIAKGCTCKNIFTLPFPESEIKALFITYRQNKKNVFEKTLSDCEFGDGTVSVNLTQEDTLKLDDFREIQIQIRVRFSDGSATKSNIVKTYADEVLKNEVI